MPSKRKPSILLSIFRAIVKSRFVEMFGDPVQNSFHWRMAPLGGNAKLINGRAYKQNELHISGKYPVLRVGNFFSNRDWYYSDLELNEKSTVTTEICYMPGRLPLVRKYGTEEKLYTIITSGRLRLAMHITNTFSASY